MAPIELNEILHTVLEVGLEHPVKILHITDVHLTESNEEDHPTQRALLEKRRAVFHGEGKPSQNEYFEEAIRLAEENGWLLMVTGDVVDLDSMGNRAEFHRIADGHDMMFAPGGHEFQHRCRRTLQEEYPYPEAAIPHVRNAYPQFNFTADSRIVGGLNIVTLDNSLDYYPKGALECLQGAIEKRLPILVFMHEPMDNGYLRHTVELHPNIDARITPEMHADTEEVVRLISEHPLIVTSFAGHDHTSRTYMAGEKTQYVTDALFSGNCRLIEVR